MNRCWASASLNDDRSNGIGPEAEPVDGITLHPRSGGVGPAASSPVIGIWRPGTLSCAVLHWIFVAAIGLMLAHAIYSVVVSLRASPRRTGRAAFEGAWVVVLGALLLYTLGVIP